MEIIGYFLTRFLQWSINSEDVNSVPAFGKIYFPVLSLFHSLDAASIAIMKSLSGSYPAFFTASIIYSTASSSPERSGANPPSSPTATESPFDLRSPASE